MESGVLYVRNSKTGEFEPIPALQGEGGGGVNHGEDIDVGVVKLAEGVLPSGSSGYARQDTGLTFGDLKKWAYFGAYAEVKKHTKKFDFGFSIYESGGFQSGIISFGEGGALSSASASAFAHWVDAKHTAFELWENKSANSTYEFSAGVIHDLRFAFNYDSESKRFISLIQPKMNGNLVPDSAKLYILNADSSATTGDILWEVRGIGKYNP